MSSFIAAALCLSLLQTCSARIPHSYRQLAQSEAEIEPSNVFVNFFNKLFRRNLSPQHDSVIRQDASNATCFQDQYYTFVYNSSFGESICDLLVDYPNETTTFDYTPVSTYTYIYTETEIDYAVVRTTPVSTVTVTESTTAIAKRDAQITPMPRDISRAQRADVFIQIFKRQAMDNGTSSMPSDSDISTSLSSACMCQTYAGATITVTYTNEPDVETLSGFQRATTTIVSTRTDRALTTTVTATVVASAAPVASVNTTSSAEGSVYVQTTGVPQGTPSTDEPSSTSDVSPSTPTAPSFTCPDDNNQTVSQMLGNERFDYDIYCDTDLPTDSNLQANLVYSSFSQCVAACSLANAKFDQPVCQGATYFETIDKSGSNCFLKSTANSPVLALGVDTAVLRRIAVGINGSNPAGTSTESVPFSGQTSSAAPGDMSSSLSSALGNSTTSMAMTTPGAGMISGRPAMAGVTAFSTYVSAGSTYSTGSVYSTYVSANGSWYYSYYSTWSEAWTSATTVYAAGETGYAVSSNNSASSQTGGNGGDYSIITDQNSTEIYYQPNMTIYNTTETIGNNTYNASGYEIYATTTTLYYTFTQAANNSGIVGGDNGSGSGSGGGIGGQGTGAPSALVSSTTSFFSTQTVIYSSGSTVGATGAFGSGVVQTPGPSLTSPTAYSTAYSTDYSTETVIVNSGATQGATGFSGAGYGGAATSTISPEVGSTVIVNTYGTAYGSGYAASGAISGNSTISGIAGSTGFAASGAISTTSSPAESEVSSTLIVETISVVTVPTVGSTVIVNTYGTAYGSGYAASGVNSANVTGGATSLFASGAIPTTSSGSLSSFSYTGAPRSGTESTTPTSPVGGVSGTGGKYSPSSSIAGAVNTSLPAPSGTAPFLTAPSPYPPLTTAASETPSPSGNFSDTAGTGTGTTSRHFSAPNGPRSGTISTSSVMMLTAPSPSGTAPLATGETSAYTNASLPSPTGTAPDTLPSGTAFIPLSTGGTAPISSGTATAPIPLSTGTAPIILSTGTLPIILSTGTSPVTATESINFGTGTTSQPFSDSNAPRSGTITTSPFPSTPTGFFPTGTAPFPTAPFPTAPLQSSCIYGNVSTTTVYMTSTVYGCYANCAPGGYGGSLSFGPPAFGPPGGFASPPVATTTTVSA